MAELDETLDPKGQPKGALVEQEAFDAQTEPQLDPIQPNTLDEFEDEEGEEGPEDILVQGEELGPDMLSLLSDQPAARVMPQEARALQKWLPVLNEIASRPGASRGLRAVADAVRQRYQDAD